VIGRQVGDLIVGDKEVSSIHAIISYERGGWYVMDLGSTNGVFVDEQVKLEARLRHNTELRVGQTRMRFELIGGGDEISADPPDLLGDRDETSSASLDLLGGGAADLTLPHVPRGGTLTGEQAAMVRDALDEEQDILAGPADGPDARPGRSAFEDRATEEYGSDDVLQGLGEAPPVQVQIEILEGADKGAVRRFTQDSVLLGRLNTDLVVRDSDVSRRHAIIEVFDATQVYLRDLNSTNGSFVNGRRVSSVRLRAGDQIRLGRCLLRFNARPVYNSNNQ
jgi:pSer/pThr/pTyr-binding forkhead associated (FHA) protein